MKTSYVSLSGVVVASIVIFASLLNVQGFEPSEAVAAHRERFVIEKPQLSVKDQIIAIAKDEGYQAPLFLVSLANCESSLDPQAVSKSGNFRGLFQIGKREHKDISDSQAFDVDFSTRFTIEHLKKGRFGMWPQCTAIINV